MQRLFSHHSTCISGLQILESFKQVRNIVLFLANISLIILVDVNEGHHFLGHESL